MTDTRKLYGKIAENGLKKYEVAGELGITAVTLYNKATNKTGFTSAEIVDLCKLLKLSKADLMEIFFPSMLP